MMTVHNVFVFPGVPSELKENFVAFKVWGSTFAYLILYYSQHLLLAKGQCQFYLKQIYFCVEEDYLATPLSQLQQEFKGVHVGSYPHDSLRYVFIISLLCIK